MLCVGYGFLLLRDGLLGSPTLRTARNEDLAVGWSSFHVVDAAWTMSAAPELCMDCVALLIDVHKKKRIDSHPGTLIKISSVPAAVAKRKLAACTSVVRKGEISM